MSSREIQASSSGQTNPIDSAFECIICMEVLVNPRVLPCGHSFCSSPKNCLSDALKMHTPPQCASCNYKLPDDIREKAVPKNYALSSAIEALKTSGNDSSEVSPTCSKHGKEQEFYCKACDVLICSRCWKVDHSKSNHDVVLFSAILESFTDLKVKLVKYKEEAEKLSDLLVKSVEQCSELLDEIRTAEKALEDVTSSTTPVEVIKHFEVFRSRLSTSTSKLESISAKSVTQQINEVHSKLAESSDFTSCENFCPLLDQRKSLDARKSEITLNSLSVCKIDTIRIEFDSDPGNQVFAVIDANKGIFYVAGYANPTPIYVYKFDGSKASLKNEMALGCRIAEMALINDELVLYKGVSPIKIEVRDKENLLLLRTVPLQLGDNKSTWCRMAGHGESMAMLYDHTDCKTMRLSLFRGKNFELFAQANTEVTKFESNYCKICFFNEETLWISGSQTQCIFTFDEKGITAKRFIRFDGIGGKYLIHRFSVLTHPALPSHQGILLIESTKGILSCKFDGRSVKDGDRILTTALPEFEGRTWKLISPSSSPSKILLISRRHSPKEWVFLSIS